MTYRNRKLLDLAHKIPCMAQFPHGCIQHLEVEPPAEYAVEAAHSDSSMFGRGMRLKTPDWAFAAMCHTAHLMLSDMGREEKFSEWLRGFKLTFDYLFDKKLIGVLK